APHVRVDGNEDIADEHLAVRRRDLRRLPKLEVGGLRLAFGPCGQHDLPGHATGRSGISPSPSSSSFASSSERSSGGMIASEGERSASSSRWPFALTTSARA